MKRRELLLSGLTITFGQLFLPRVGSTQELGLGSFSGNVVLKFIGQSMRRAILEQEFSYKDLGGKIWSVPKGAEVDGASIPKVFFSYIGGPFSDKYREPSIIHDHYCTVKTTSYQSAHAVFHEAMLQNGVPTFKAWVMYKAVEKFGPKWPAPLPEHCSSGGLIDLTDCTQNSGIDDTPTINHITNNQVNNFLADVRSSTIGYSSNDLSELEGALKQL